MFRMDLKSFIIDVPNFPSQGVVFRDITPILSNPEAFEFALSGIAGPFVDKEIDVVAAIESRGFILGAPLASRLGVGFVPIRKKGKLPRSVISEPLVKEYGDDVIEIHQDAIAPGSRVLIVDDVLATGGTLESAVKMLKKAGAEIAGIALLINLSYLPGKDKLLKVLPATIPIHYILEY